MKEREAIRMFDHIRPETLAETDLGREESNSSASGSPAEAPKGRVFSWKPLLALAAALAIVAVSVLTATAPRSALGLAGPEYPPGTSYNDSKEYQDLDEGKKILLIHPLVCSMPWPWPAKGPKGRPGPSYWPP